MELALVAEGGIKATAVNTYGVNRVLHGSTFVALFSKNVHRFFEDLLPIEFLGTHHTDLGFPNS